MLKKCVQKNQEPAFRDLWATLAQHCTKARNGMSIFMPLSVNDKAKVYQKIKVTMYVLTPNRNEEAPPILSEAFLCYLSTFLIALRIDSVTPIYSP